MHYGNRSLCREPVPYGKERFAVGKPLAVSGSRRSPHDKRLSRAAATHGEPLFTGDVDGAICREPHSRLMANNKPLSWARSTAHGKRLNFAVSRGSGSRQSPRVGCHIMALCREVWQKLMAKSQPLPWAITKAHGKEGTFAVSFCHYSRQTSFSFFFSFMQFHIWYLKHLRQFINDHIHHRKFKNHIIITCSLYITIHITYSPHKQMKSKISSTTTSSQPQWQVVHNHNEKFTMTSPQLQMQVHNHKCPCKCSSAQNNSRLRRQSRPPGGGRGGCWPDHWGGHATHPEAAWVPVPGQL